MTPETKAWVEKWKKLAEPLINEDMTGCVPYDEIWKMIQIIESQEKEIERLKIELMKPCLICATAVYNADLVLPKDRS